MATYSNFNKQNFMPQVMISLKLEYSGQIDVIAKTLTDHICVWLEALVTIEISI